MNFKIFLSLFVIVGVMSCAFAQNEGLLTDFQRPVANGQEALDFLMAGNARFVQGLDNSNINLNFTVARRNSILSQNPQALVLSCADSRLAPEILFNVGMGNIFAPRVSGFVLSPELLGTIDFAIETFDMKLVVVLGHAKCGVVTKAINTAVSQLDRIQAGLNPIVKNPANLNYDHLMQNMYPSIKAAIDKYGSENIRTPAAVSFTERSNAMFTCNQIVTNSAVVQSRMASSKFMLVVAEYQLNGTVIILSKNGCAPSSQYAMRYESATPTSSGVVSSTTKDSDSAFGDQDVVRLAIAMVVMGCLSTVAFGWMMLHHLLKKQAAAVANPPNPEAGSGKNERVIFREVPAGSIPVTTTSSEAGGPSSVTLNVA